MAAFEPSEAELSPEQLTDLLEDERWQVIDVRETYEREAGHIAGTRHIELGQLASEAGSIDRDRPVAFYCRIGSRSGMAVQAFRADGWNAHHLTGGIAAWAERGLPLVPEDGIVADH